MPAERWEWFAGKSFWVTGAGTGYGQSIAVALALARARVFFTGRRREKLLESIAQVLRLGGEPDRCHSLPADITDPREVLAAADAIRRDAGRLNAVICNAALPQERATDWPLAEQGFEEWEGLIRTNLTGQWLTARAALPLLQEAASIRTLFVTSEAGWASTCGFGPYNVSKAALNSLAMSYAEECARRHPDHDVQINALVPGEARTEMNQGAVASPFSVVSMTLALLSHPPGGPNGRFFHRDGRHLEFGYATRWQAPLLTASPLANSIAARPAQAFREGWKKTLRFLLEFGRLR